METRRWFVGLLRLPSSASLALGCVGAAILAAADSLPVLVAGGVVLELGVGMYPTVARLLVVGLVAPEHQQEALAWQRSTANLGLVVAFGLGSWFGGQVTALLALEAACSGVAALLALRLPDARSEPVARGGKGSAWLPFLWMTAIASSFAFGYEGFNTALAAQLRVIHGEDGLAWYSTLNLINVVGCSVFGVFAARWIGRRPAGAVAAGAALMAVGAVVAVAVPGDLWLGGLGLFLVTAGEILNMAVSGFVWIVLVPRGPRRATTFALANTAAIGIRSLGGALAFPFVLAAEQPGLGMVALVAPALVLPLFAAPVWRAFHSAVAEGE